MSSFSPYGKSLQEEFLFQGKKEGRELERMTAGGKEG
jgi:hypothetical protein